MDLKLEGLSKPSCNLDQACEVNESLEEIMIEFVPSDKSSEVLEPADGSLDLPASLIPAQRSTILGRRFLAIAFVGSDQLGTTFFQPRSQRVAVSSLVVDQLARSTPDHAFSKQRLDESYFVWAGTFDQVATRRATTVREQQDLGPFAAFGLTYAKAPFFAEANVPSAIDSAWSILPWRSSLLTNRDHACLNNPDSDQCFKRRQQVGYEGKCDGKSRQRAPVRNTQAMASKQSREDARGRPPKGDGGGSSNKSEIRPHCSSVSSNSGSVLDTTLESASAEWDRVGIHGLLSTMNTQTKDNGLINY